MRPRGVMRVACVLCVMAACAENPTLPEASPTTGLEPQFHIGPPTEAVTDLSVSSSTRHTATLTWTQVDDGKGSPARYRLRYARTPIVDWSASAIGCDEVVGETIGIAASCTVTGLDPLTDYDFQLMSFRVGEGPWEGTVRSNVASARTDSVNAPGPVDDLRVTSATPTSLALAWTSVDDGTGRPALYQVRYASSTAEWDDAAIACGETLSGEAVGTTMICAIDGLSAGTRYDVRLSSYRMVDGAVTDAHDSNVASAETAELPGVLDLEVVSVTPTTMSLAWTQVEDGAGGPARYRVKYAVSPLVDWKSATVGCDARLVGDGVASPMSCTLEGLEPGATYDVQLMSYRLEDGEWAGQRYSNIATGTTRGTTGAGRGIWVDADSIASAPRAGPVWTRIEPFATADCGPVDLSNPQRFTHLCVMTKALLYAATGVEARRAEVMAALDDFSDDSYSETAWVLGRELPAYVIAADLIDLPANDPGLDERFRAQLVRLRETPTDSGSTNLVECHERRPNNLGTHCGAARAAIAAYLQDQGELERVATVFRGYVGDRDAYAGFVFGGPEGDLTWQCDPAAPVAVNPADCARDGQPIGGVLPDDQRRSGPFTWPPPRENYVWEALQGAVLQAVILHNAGYRPFEWEDSALLRAVTWLHEQAQYPAEGDDHWVTHIINYFYGTSFPAPVPANPGKNVAWTEWTHPY